MIKAFSRYQFTGYKIKQVEEAPMEDYNRLLEELRRQEETLQFTEFTNDTAYHLGQLVLELARQDHLGVTVDIIRHGQQLFHASLPGTSSDND
jgi:uncharacterized protein (UPF0303 family)